MWERGGHGDRSGSVLALHGGGEEWLGRLIVLGNAMPAQDYVSALHSGRYTARMVYFAVVSFVIGTRKDVNCLTFEVNAG